MVFHHFIFISVIITTGVQRVLSVLLLSSGRKPSFTARELWDISVEAITEMADFIGR